MATRVQHHSFDDAATLAMGEAFDHACVSLRRIGKSANVREIIAKRIIAAAKTGERDPIRLYEQALIPFGIEDMSMPVLGAGSVSPVTTVGITGTATTRWPAASRPTRQGAGIFIQRDNYGY